MPQQTDDCFKSTLLVMAVVCSAAGLVSLLLGGKTHMHARAPLLLACCQAGSRASSREKCKVQSSSAGQGAVAKEAQRQRVGCVITLQETQHKHLIAGFVHHSTVSEGIAVMSGQTGPVGAVPEDANAGRSLRLCAQPVP